MGNNYFISICIPCYNRPAELSKLLLSIDYKTYSEIEIVICEDNSPKRKEIKDVIEAFRRKTLYEVIYKENEQNLGYDKNLRALIKTATGKFIIFMGDDDEFVPGALDKYISFLKNNGHLGYVLRSYRTVHSDGVVEEFRYYPKTIFFKSGYDTYIQLFRKSIFISGFTFNRESGLPFLTGRFDGTLLFQLYILSEIVLKHESAYCDIIITQRTEGGIPMFGSSKAEQAFYVPGKITIENSLNFMASFFKITAFIDKKYNYNSTSHIKMDISKYSYPALSIQRNKGIKEFFRYFKGLNRIGINCSFYYYIYFVSLIIFGEKFCDKVIQFIKKTLKKTPRL